MIARTALLLASASLCMAIMEPMAPGPAPMTAGPSGPFKLPKLTFGGYGAIEPYMDAQTMEIHYTKHHQTYVTNLNNFVATSPGNAFASLSLSKMLYALGSSSLPAGGKATTLVRNNAGGHANHIFWWSILTPAANATKEPVGELAAAINAKYGNFSSFKTKFTKAATDRFGSGFAWLIVTNSTLEIISLANQDNPLMTGLASPAFGMTGFPVLNLDVWEHAYYLKYQNRRPDFIKAFWEVVNWNQAEKYYQAAKTGSPLNLDSAATGGPASA